MELKNEIERLISKYSKHLDSGIRIEQSLREQKSSKAHCQKDLNKIWIYVLKDLRNFVDKSKYESGITDKPRRS